MSLSARLAITRPSATGRPRRGPGEEFLGERGHRLGRGALRLVVADRQPRGDGFLEVLGERHHGREDLLPVDRPQLIGVGPVDRQALVVHRDQVAEQGKPGVRLAVGAADRHAGWRRFLGRRNPRPGAGRRRRPRPPGQTTSKGRSSAGNRSGRGRSGRAPPRPGLRRTTWRGSSSGSGRLCEFRIFGPRHEIHAGETRSVGSARPAPAGCRRRTGRRSSPGGRATAWRRVPKSPG